MLHQGKVGRSLHLVLQKRLGSRVTRKHVEHLEGKEKPEQAKPVELEVDCHSTAEKSLQIGATRWKRPGIRLHHPAQSGLDI
jgi:hypothetical protein